MSIFSSHKKFFLLGFLLVILIAIPLTVYVAQQRQQTDTKAAVSTKLSFVPASSTLEVGEILTLDIELDPASKTPSNQVSFVKLSINFDPTRFATLSGAEGESLREITDGNNLKEVLEEASYENGKASISLSIGANPVNVVTQKTKIATLKLKAITPTTAGDPAEIKLNTNSGETQVLSIAGTDRTSENVLISSIESAAITINPSSAPTPSVVTPTATSSGSVGLGVAPICSALNPDRSATGSAPYSITFTAIGNDTDGTISKASFNFGDGPVEAVTTGGGIGTNSVNAQMSHTYNNPGTYTAYAILTDNQGNLSDQAASCTKTITVNAAVGGPEPETPEPEVPVEPPVVVTLPPTGPGETIIGIGILGVIITIAGAALFLLL